MPSRNEIRRALRREVWNKYIGARKPEGPCFACQKRVSFQDFEVGHVRARSRGGKDSIENLRPVHRSCNLAMGRMTPKEYNKLIRPQRRDRRVVALIVLTLAVLGILRYVCT